MPKYKSVRGLFLSDFPVVVACLDTERHPDVNTSEVQAGTNKKYWWKYNCCNDTYEISIITMCQQNKSRSCKKCEIEKKIRNKIQSTRIPNERRSVPQAGENDIEEWKDLPAEQLLSNYQISTLGRMKNKKTGYISQIKANSAGYVNRGIRNDDGIIKLYYYHILVAKALLPNPNNLPTVNHINQNRSDNRLINLEWASVSEQNFAENKVKKSEINKRSSRFIHQLTIDGTLVKTWTSVTEAQRVLGIPREKIYQVCRLRINPNRDKVAGGYKWEYVVEEANKEEMWKELDLEQYNCGKVLVSNFGRLRRKYHSTYGTVTSGGYLKAEIPVISKIKSEKCNFLMHRLVAMAFLPNPNNYPVVNHINLITHDNRLENLEWTTARGNLQHYYQSEVGKSRKVERQKAATCKPVVQIHKKTNEVVAEFFSMQEAKRLTGIDGKNIGYCCKGTRKTAGGYKWSYKN